MNKKYMLLPSNNGWLYHGLQGEDPEEMQVYRYTLKDACLAMKNVDIKCYK